jgi:rhodanese-related sulfurtransferase
MKRRILVLSGLAALALLPLSARAEEKNSFGSLTVDQVSDLISKHDVKVFDNNSRDRFKESHVPTAKWVDFKNVQASDLPQDKDRTLIFYCANEK